MRLLILALALALSTLVLLVIRLAPMPPDRWHLDPSMAERPGTPNAYLLRDRDGDGPSMLFAASPAAVAQALDQMLATAPRVTRIAGSAAEGLVTYVQRSRILGFPDAISIRLTPENDGTRVEIFSRSRFGYGDAGVNRARVIRWMDRLGQTLTP